VKSRRGKNGTGGGKRKGKKKKKKRPLNMQRPEYDEKEGCRKKHPVAEGGRKSKRKRESTSLQRGNPFRLEKGWQGEGGGNKGVHKKKSDLNATTGGTKGHQPQAGRSFCTVR